MRGGIKWPEVLQQGGLHTAILQTDEEDDEELNEIGMLMSASFGHDPPTILFSEKKDPRRRDNDICHELGHMIFVDVLGLQYEGTEADAQGIGNFIHALLEQVLTEHGVKVYEPTMEVERTTSLREIAGRRREMAEAVAASDLDREGGSLGSPGSPHSRRRNDPEPRYGSEVEQEGVQESGT